jgi:hypothetical protein
MDDSGATSLNQIRAFVARRYTLGQRRRWCGIITPARADGNRDCCGSIYIARIDGSQPGTGDPSDHELYRQGPSEGGDVSTEEILDPVHEIGRGTAGLRRHGNLSGPATKRILERECSEYGQAAYQRQAGILVAQIYQFRNSAIYRQRNSSYQLTRPTPIPIGERRKPRPQGRPRYLRIDTVHQGTGMATKACTTSMGRRTDARGDRGGHPVDLGTLVDSVTGTFADFIPTTAANLSIGGQTARQATHRTDQVPCASIGRQGAGGVEEWSGHSQTHRLRTHRRATRRSRPPVSSSVSEG